LAIKTSAGEPAERGFHLLVGQRVAELGDAVAEGGAAGVLAQHQGALGDADDGR
jgi:hypothetical protein